MTVHYSPPLLLKKAGPGRGTGGSFLLLLHGHKLFLTSLTAIPLSENTKCSSI